MDLQKRWPQGRDRSTWKRKIRAFTKDRGKVNMIEILAMLGASTQTYNSPDGAVAGLLVADVEEVRNILQEVGFGREDWAGRCERKDLVECTQ